QQRQQIEQKRKAREMEILARQVTLGRWAEVGSFLESLPAAERKPSYLHLLTALRQPPQQQGQPQMPPQFAEQNDFSFDDLVALVDAAPAPVPPEPGAPAEAAPPSDGSVVDKATAAALAPLFRLSVDANRSFEALLERLRKEVLRPEAERVLQQREVARILVALGRELELGAFLPDDEDAITAGDREALNLLARHYHAQYRKTRAPSALEKAWNATQAALAAGEI